MRNLLIVVLVLAVGVSAGARSIADSHVPIVADPVRPSWDMMVPDGHVARQRQPRRRARR